MYLLEYKHEKLHAPDDKSLKMNDATLRAGVRVLSWDPIVRFGGNLAQLFRHIP